MASSEVRAPGLTVAANGIAVPGVLAAEIQADSHLGANRFQFRASLTASGGALWAQNDFQIEIGMALGGTWASLISGAADRISIDPIHGEVCVEGRDLTARFIAARTQESFENQTASQIAEILAVRRGLTAVVVPTSLPVGRYFQNAHSRTTLDQYARATTEWDLLARLAEVEGYDLWIDGQILNFIPSGPNGTLLAVTPADCLSVRLERAMDIAGGIDVTVKSWDCRGQAAIVQSSSGGSDAALASYMIVRPNLSADVAQSLALRVRQQMLAHGRTVCLEMPGDLTTTPRMLLALSSTGTDFDGDYMISAVERHVSFRGGFTQAVQARIPDWTTF